MQTHKKSEMLTLVEIFSLADISYKTFFKQPPNLCKGLLTEKQLLKKQPMRQTKLFSFLNLAKKKFKALKYLPCCRRSLS